MSEIDYRAVLPEGWNRARGFSYGVVATGGRILRNAGQIAATNGNTPVDPDLDFGGQWERAMGNLVTILRAAGGEPEHLVMLRAYVTDVDAFNAAGPAVGEPYNPPAPARPFAEEVGADPGRLKIGFSCETPLGDPLDPECKHAIRETAALCESLGHEVVEAMPRFDTMELWQKFTTILSGGVAWALADWQRRLDRELSPQYFEPFVWAFSERGRGLSAADYLLALQDVQCQVRALCQFFETHDMWLTTTLGQPPVPLGTLVYKDDPFELRRRMAKFSPYTYISNASGQPAMSVPLHWTDDDLPVGLHFVGRFGEEAVLFRLAAQLEAAKPWADRRPPVCAD